MSETPIINDAFSILYDWIVLVMKCYQIVKHTHLLLHWNDRFLVNVGWLATVTSWAAGNGSAFEDGSVRLHHISVFQLPACSNGSLLSPQSACPLVYSKVFYAIKAVKKQKKTKTKIHPKWCVDDSKRSQNFSSRWRICISSCWGYLGVCLLTVTPSVKLFDRS